MLHAGEGRLKEKGRCATGVRARDGGPLGAGARLGSGASGKASLAGSVDWALKDEEVFTRQARTFLIEGTKE